MLISYAQNHEDIILYRVFKKQTNGFYIDIGACFPTEGSVTKLFYDNGWQGINIEPHPEAYQLLISDRVRDINLNIAISNLEGTLTLYEYESIGETSATFKEGAHCFEVPTISLKTLCDRYAKEEIDFLKIDVEGHEYEVIVSGDWSRYRPKVVICEITKSWSNEKRSDTDSIDNFFKNQSYYFAYFDGINHYYVAHEHIDMLNMISIQPNVIDNFTPYASVIMSKNLKQGQDEIGVLQQKILEKDVLIENSRSLERKIEKIDTIIEKITNNFEDQLFEYNIENKNLHDKLTQSIEEKYQIEKKLRDLLYEDVNSKARCKYLETQNQDLTKKIVEQQNFNHHLEQTISELQEFHSLLEKRISEQQDLNNQLFERLTAIEQLKNELQKENSIAINVITVDKQEINRLQSKIFEMNQWGINTQETIRHLENSLAVALAPWYKKKSLLKLSKKILKYNLKLAFIFLQKATKLAKLFIVSHLPQLNDYLARNILLKKIYKIITTKQVKISKESVMINRPSQDKTAHTICNCQDEISKWSRGKRINVN